MSASVTVSGVEISGWGDVRLSKSLGRHLPDDIRLIFAVVNPNEPFNNMASGEAQFWAWDSYEQLMVISNVSFEKFKFLALEMNMEQSSQDPKVFIKRKF